MVRIRYGGVDLHRTQTIDRGTLMAKRKKASPAAKPEDTSQRTRIVKLRLTDKETRLIRVAAAFENLRPAEFARNVVLVHAKELAKKYLDSELD